MGAHDIDVQPARDVAVELTLWQYRLMGRLLRLTDCVPVPGTGLPVHCLQNFRELGTPGGYARSFIWSHRFLKQRRRIGELMWDQWTKFARLRATDEYVESAMDEYVDHTRHPMLPGADRMRFLTRSLWRVEHTWQMAVRGK